MGKLRHAIAATVAGFATACFATTAGSAPPAAAGADARLQARIRSLEQRIAQLEQRTRPELGQQMLLLELRHDRLWWAAEAGNWNLAYYMAGELGEAIQGIVETNGDAAELQPQKLSELMPGMLDAPLKNLQDAIGTHDRRKFEAAYDDLSAACTGCHKVAGNPMLLFGGVALVLAAKAARVLAGGAGLGAKARRIRAVVLRQRLGVEDLVGVEVRDLDLRGRRQEQIVIGLVVGVRR